MIVVLISDESERERNEMVYYTKELAGLWTDEYWNVLSCTSLRELEQFAATEQKADILCIDITMKGALELTKKLRQISPAAYIILIASAQIRPTIYMRPTIGAESLMLKPLDRGQIHEVLSEAIQTYLKRFFAPDETQVFVLETKKGRELISYDNIYFFESREKRVFLNTSTEEYGFYDTLEQLEGRLADMFLRCHRSFLVNKSKIEKVQISQNRLVLECEFEIPLSRSYKPAVKEFLMAQKEGKK